MPGILICEDEENIISFLKPELEYEGFTADAALDGSTALELFRKNNYDLVLLDIMLPEKNGLEVLREIRKTSKVPVIIITARKEVYDKVAFLNAGAGDYVTKPFDTLELLARVRRSIERNNLPESGKGLRVLEESYIAFFDGAELSLTKTEFEILLCLYKNIGKVKTREEIIREVFGDYYGESNIVDANVKNIRAKLSRHSERTIITTVRGKGYVILKDET